MALRICWKSFLATFSGKIITLGILTVIFFKFSNSVENFLPIYEFHYHVDFRRGHEKILDLNDIGMR